MTILRIPAGRLLTFGVPPSGGKTGPTRVNAELRTPDTPEAAGPAEFTDHVIASPFRFVQSLP